MGVYDILDELQRKAKKDAFLRKRLLDTRQAEQPLSEFCRVCRELV